MNWIKLAQSAAPVLMCMGIASGDDLAFSKADMSAAFIQITENNKPLILYVSHTTCPYCKRLDNDIMPAVLNSENYQNSVVLQKLVWDSAIPVTWVGGEEKLPDQIVTDYRVRATPTLLFLDEKGQEIAKRIEGYQGPDFYWVYLDERIEQAQLALMGR
jgi:thioredoxin-related protein